MQRGGGVREEFYVDNIKIVPKNMRQCRPDYLTSVGLAFWIMDDGSYNKQGPGLETYFYVHGPALLIQCLVGFI